MTAELLGACIRLVSACSVVVALVVAASACGSDEATRTSPPTSGATSTAASTLQTGYSAVAVAGNRAVVADGSVPTRFTVARLTTGGAETQHEIEPGPPMLVRSLEPIGDRILIAGNSCDSVRLGAAIDDACEPGRSVIGLFDPVHGAWVDLTIGDDAGSIGNVSAVATPDHRASVYVTVRVPGEDTRLEGRFFDLDVHRGALTARSLPPGIAGDDEDDLMCLRSDGSATTIISDSSVQPGAPASRRAWQLDPTAGWSAIDLPATVSAADGCVAGRPVVVEPDGDRFILASVGDWKPFPRASELFGGAHRGVPVVGASDNRRWAGGRVWTYDERANSFVELGIPSERVEGSVRASAAWGAGHIVALVDPSTELVDGSAPAHSTLEVFSTS